MHMHNRYYDYLTSIHYDLFGLTPLSITKSKYSVLMRSNMASYLNQNKTIPNISEIKASEVYFISNGLEIFLTSS